MRQSDKSINIPYDVYESPTELVIILPLSGVRQDSIGLQIKDYTLLVTATREQPKLKDDLVPKAKKCYRGAIKLKINLPPNIYFDKIHSKLSSNSILTIVIPKNIIPEHIPIQIAQEN